MNKYILLIILISLSACGVGLLDRHDEQENEKFYCEMIGLYAFDKESGINANHRRGWPNYKKLEC